MPQKQKPRAGGQWTEAKFWGFIRSSLRSASSRWPVKYVVLKEASLPNDGQFDKRTKTIYICSKCKKKFKRVDVQVDHIIPAGTLKSAKDLPAFVESLFCEKEGLQVLCKPCHQKKTNRERGQNA